MDDSQAQRYAAVIDRIKADGAAAGLGPDELHAKIMDFVQQAKAMAPPVSERQAALRAGIEKQRAKVAEQVSKPDPMSMGEIGKAIVTPWKDRLVSMARGAMALGKGVGNEALLAVGGGQPAATGDEIHNESGGAAVPYIPGRPGAFGGTPMSLAQNRQLLRGMSDTVSFGGAEKLANAADPKFKGTADQDAADEPDYRTAGGILGAVTPGGASDLLTKNVTGGLKMLPKAGALAARPAIQSLAAAPIIGGVAGGAMGGGYGALAGAADPMTLMPPLIGLATSAALRGASPTIGRFASSKEAGMYDDPAMQGLKSGPAGIQQAREIAQKRVTGRQVERRQQAANEYHQGLGELRSPPPPEFDYVDTPVLRGNHGDQAIEDITRDLPPSPGRENASALLSAARQIDVPGAETATPYQPQMPVRRPAPPPEGLARPIDRQALLSALESRRTGRLNPNTGMPYYGEEGADTKLQALIKSLGPESQEVRDVQADYGRRQQPTVNTVGAALEQRRILGRHAGFRSADPTPEQLDAQANYFDFRDSLRDAAKDVGALDDKYSDFARGDNRASDILYRSEDNVIKNGGAHPDQPPIDFADEIGQRPPQMRVGHEKAARATLGRIDDTNEPGLAAAPYLKELADMDPEYKAAIDFLAAKKAHAGTRLSLTGMKPTGLNGAVAFGGFGPAIEQNARAIGAQAVDPALRSTLSPGALRLNILTQIARADEDRKREMAARLAQQRVMQTLRTGLGQQ